MLTYDQAYLFALKKHAGQKDKAGFSYILHLKRVAEAVSTEDEKIVAILHDILEDTSTTLDELIALGCTADHVDAIVHITKLKGLTYTKYLQQVASNRLSFRVKMKDIDDNSNKNRLDMLETIEAKRLEDKYTKARHVLMQYRLSYISGE